MKFTSRQEEIILAATEIIGEYGIQQVTTSNLAKKMNFTEPALYRHFKNKNDILRSILLYFKTEIGAELQRIINSDKSGLEKVLGVIKFQIDFFIKTPAVIMVVISETSFQNEKSLSKTVKNVLKERRKLVSEIIKEGQIDGSIRTDINVNQLINIVLGSMRVTVLNWKLNGYDFDMYEESKSLLSTLEKILK
jgi:AcrR family transcriptional regulator